MSRMTWPTRPGSRTCRGGCPTLRKFKVSSDSRRKWSWRTLFAPWSSTSGSARKRQNRPVYLMGISNMQFRIALACAAMLLGVAATSSAQAVSLQFNDGRVSLNAQNAPVRAILFEWARLGGTRIVNGERLGGAPVTLELTD